VPRYTNDTSHSLFPPTTTNAQLPRRFINQDNPKQFLIYTDGACLNNGQANPKGGCSAVFRPPTRTRQYFGRISFALEHRGPTGKLHQQTSNRAELRAVIAALRFRSWDGEGFNSLVIATDSTYVVEGSTSWVYAWMRNGWETRAGTPVKNQDLWQCLFDEIEKAHRSSLRIQFWHIPREWNEWADLYAKEGAEMTRRDYFKDIVSSEEY
jgi:ribonuclease HI